MRVLVIDTNIHHKNRQGLIMMLDYLQATFAHSGKEFFYKFGSFGNIGSLHWNVVISPAVGCDTSLYASTKFLFGPHFSVFPNNQLTRLNANMHNNAVYITPSVWVADMWKRMRAEQAIPMSVMPFPVNLERFAPDNYGTAAHDDNRGVVIYFKRRKESELQILENTLKEKDIHYKVFNYVKGYEEASYLAALKKAKYGIVLDAHESQGFAIEEAMACNVPLLVWNATSMAQEEGVNYPDYPATSIPYWDETCGEVFTDWFKEFNIIFERFEKG